MSTQTFTTKKEIHRAACVLFRERGFHASSVRDIAQRVGLRGASLYAHVQKKDDLLWEIVNEAGDQFFDALRKFVYSPLPVVEKLRQAIIAHAKVITSDPDGATVFTVEWRHLSPERQAAITRRRDEYEQTFRSLVEEAMQSGDLAATDAAAAARFVLASLNSVVFWYKPEGRLSPEQIGRMLADYLFHGLCGTRAEPSLTCGESTVTNAGPDKNDGKEVEQ